MTQAPNNTSTLPIFPPSFDASTNTTAPSLEPDNGGIFTQDPSQIEVETGEIGNENPVLARHIRNIIQSRVVPYLRSRQLARVEAGLGDGPDGFVLLL